MLDRAVLNQLMSSTLYKQIEAEGDIKRLEAHRAALEAIAQHEKATKPVIEKARKDLTRAEGELKRIEPEYNRARNQTLAAASVLQDLEFSTDHVRGRLEGKLNEHLPPAVLELERVLPFIGNDLRAAYRVKSSWEPKPLTGGRAELVQTNQPEIDAAQAQREKILGYCKDLRTKPAPSTEIMETLNRELGKLRKLAHSVGVDINPHLPEAFRQA